MSDGPIGKTMTTQSILTDLKKHFQGITLLSDEDSPCVVSEWLSTGCLALDVIMGGGLPVGRVTEIYGDTSTGKSLLAEQVAAYTQQQGHLVVYLDPENAVSIDMMKEVGVDPDNLIYYSPDTVEEIFDIMEKTISIKEKQDPDKILLIVWDSIAATSAKQELEDEVGKANYGLHAKLISQGLRRITRLISKGRVCCLFLNQTRQKIGVMFGDDEATFGGKAVPFHSSIRVRLKKGQKIKSADKVTGIMTQATVVKNKLAVPFRQATLPIFFGHGIDDALATFYFLEGLGHITGTGSYKTFSINGDEIKVQRSGNWPDVYDEHYEKIQELAFTS